VTPGEGYALIIEAFNKLDIEFFVGGSIASSFHGIPRGTRDVDIIAAILPKHAEPLAELLSGEFYADRDLIQSAIRIGRSFNLIHLATSYKFDIFPLQSDDFHLVQFARRQAKNLTRAGLPGVDSYVASAEDTLLEKLRWYRKGGSTSDRQWHDILSILQVQHLALDWPYLDKWALYLHVADLLDRARSEAAPGRPPSPPGTLA